MADLHIVLEIVDEEGHVDSELPEGANCPKLVAHLNVPGLLQKNLSPSDSQEHSEHSVVSAQKTIRTLFSY